jgi:hypothetical protein
MKFDELSLTAKEHALYEYCEFLARMNYWWEPLMEDLKEELKNEYGLVDVNVMFQLAYVQSDTVVFTLEHEALNNALLAKAGLDSAGVIAERLARRFNVPEDYIPELEDELLHNSALNGKVGITSPAGLTVELDGLHDAIYECSMGGKIDGEAVQEEIDTIDGAVNEALYDRAKQFYHELDREWEQLCTEDELREAADANNWDFDENGDLI